MHWPADHPIHDDPTLAAVASGADELCPDAKVVATLRHVAARRVTSLVELAGPVSDGGPGEAGRLAVLKVFARPRARGNERRLRALAGSGPGPARLVPARLVPAPLGADRSGHVGLVSYRPGVVLDQLPDPLFLSACRCTGEALRALHDSPAELDRSWTRADELRQLHRRAPQSLAPLLRSLELDRRLDRAATIDGPLVPSHRDCHPRQVVHTGAGVAWIDLDDCAMAPAALDVGNMMAHLTREAVLGRRAAPLIAAAQAQFLAGYRWTECHPGQLGAWVQLSLLRLAGLAETRHGSAGERDALLIEASGPLVWRADTGVATG